jgi:hypothetical protein
MKATLLSLAAGLLALPFSAVAGPLADYVAHEWGTFTSVQGADGAQMNWNPFSVAELPKFVYDRTRPENGRMILLTKTAMFAKQRLETPVIYFHSKKPLTVDATVFFPKGTVTEWFPRASVPAIRKAGEPAIEWKGVSVVPRTEKKLTTALPREANGSHYYAAREADADFVRTTDKDKKTEVEKFLFYRGVGGFDAPLMVTLPSADETRLVLLNTTAEPLRDLFLVQVRDGQMAITSIPEIVGNHSADGVIGKPQPLAAGRKQLAAQMQAALVRTGLYESEAASMVKTWDDSWFAEAGVRVLYVLPTKWADEILPLKLTPAPKEVARVFVGRAEVITPTMEQALAAEVSRYPSDRAAAIANVRTLGLGRFLEPAFRRLVQQHPEDRAFSTTGWELLQAASAPGAPPRLSAR